MSSDNRDQVFKHNRTLPKEITWPSKGKTRKSLYAFHNAKVRPRLIIHIWDMLPTWYPEYQLQHIFMLNMQGPTSGPCHWVGYAPKSYLTRLTRQESSEITQIVQNNPDKVRRGSDKFRNNSDWLKTTQTDVQTTRPAVKTTRHGLEAWIGQQGVLRHYTTKLGGSPSLRPRPGGSGFKDGGCKNQDSSHHSMIIKDYNKPHNTIDPSSEFLF
jgi:hypothetical protein